MSDGNDQQEVLQVKMFMNALSNLMIWGHSFHVESDGIGGCKVYIDTPGGPHSNFKHADDFIGSIGSKTIGLTVQSIPKEKEVESE